MTAYAAVVSLMNTTDAITNHPHLSSCLDKEQIQSLGKKLSLLLDYIENHTSHGYDQEAGCLLRKIAYAAHAAEDVIESHIVDQIHAGVLEKAPTFFIDLQKIIQGMDLQKITASILREEVMESIDQPMLIQNVRSENNPSCLPLHKLHLSNKRIAQGINHIKGKVTKLIEKMGSNNLEKQPINPTPAPSEPAITVKATMVGFDDYLIQLLDGLTYQDSHRKVIPIVGMGGIGKTTLARNAYENLLTVHHFDVRAWVSISQQYSVKKILVELLSSLGQSTSEIDEKLEEDDEGALSVCLYKFLSGRRYLVVLDDMWSFTVWEEIRFSFPENYSGSRIVVTTRLLELANDFGSPRALVIDLLDDNTSWDLFLENAFTQESCPCELEHMGKTIVKKCKGLPLSIVVIGALLGKSRTQEYWESIVENISSILNSTHDNQLLDVLCLSYNHLPARLKPCFLYLGMFPEDYEISVSRLIKLWIAEGFIKPDKDKSLEEVAEGYINDLLSRNLILVGRLGWNRKCETFYVHDLLRDVCLREAEKEKFFCIMKTAENLQGIDREERRIVIRQGTWIHTLSSTSIRSLICESSQPLIESKLLRVLVADHRNKSYDPAVAFAQVNMRLLAYECARRNKHTFDKFNQSWLRSRLLLWNLQTLIFTQRTKVNAPDQIWNHRQLRHVEFWLIRLPLPSSSPRQEDMVLHNLQTLMKVEDLCNEEFFRRIPNVKRLHLYYENLLWNDKTDFKLHNIVRLDKLESLSFKFAQAPNHYDLLHNLKFPPSLKELSLGRCGLHWDDDVTIIGSLPNLEVLKLKWDSFVGEEWNPVEGEFLRLKYLEIGFLDLREWNADSSHFPVLETLVLRDLSDLDVIPMGVGEILTLRVIRVEDCSTSAAVAAMKIGEEQESEGNDGLQIQLKFKEKREMERFMKEVEAEGITCHNFKLNK